MLSLGPSHEGRIWDLKGSIAFALWGCGSLSLSQLGLSAWRGSCAFRSAPECTWFTCLPCWMGLPGRRRSWDTRLCGFGQVPYLRSFLSLKRARPWPSPAGERQYQPIKVRVTAQILPENSPPHCFPALAAPATPNMSPHSGPWSVLFLLRGTLPSCTLQGPLSSHPEGSASLLLSPITLVSPPCSPLLRITSSPC